MYKNDENEEDFGHVTAIEKVESPFVASYLLITAF